jgi:hypothetical protein
MAASGAFNVAVPPATKVMVALPPSQQTGAVKFARCFLSLASDFGGATVRLAIGQPGQFNVENNLNVPAGRTVVRELRATDQVASIIHQAGEPVAVLIECQGLG